MIAALRFRIQLLPVLSWRAHAVTAEKFRRGRQSRRHAWWTISSAVVWTKWLPLMAYVRKLTLSPSRLVAADAQAVFAAGWDEQALHDTIAVVCLFKLHEPVCRRPWHQRRQRRVCGARQGPHGGRV